MGLGDHQRIRTVRFWTEKLPRTPTRKIKRKEVREQLIRLVDVGKSSRREGMAVPVGREPAWLYGAVAALVGIESVDIVPSTDLVQDLGLSSLQYVELRLLIEEKTKGRIDPDRLAACQTVADLVRVVDDQDTAPISFQAETVNAVRLPETVSGMGKQLLGGRSEHSTTRFFTFILKVRKIFRSMSR